MTAQRALEKTADQTGLAAIREEIDRVDTELLDALRRRMDCVRRVAEWKKENGLPVRDRAREETVVRRVRENAGEEYADSAEKVYRALFDAACAYEEKHMEEKA